MLSCLLSGGGLYVWLMLDAGAVPTDDRPMSRFRYSRYATDWGTPSRVTTDSLAIVIDLLENYELRLSGFDDEALCAVPSPDERADANAIVSVLHMLKKEHKRRQRLAVLRHVSKQAEAQGWQMSKVITSEESA